MRRVVTSVHRNNMQLRQTNPLESFLAFSEANRTWVHALAAACVAIIAWIDWKVINVSLGFLYVVPIVIASAVLNVPRILLFAMACGILRELFSPVHPSPAAWCAS